MRVGSGVGDGRLAERAGRLLTVALCSVLMLALAACAGRAERSAASGELRPLAMSQPAGLQYAALPSAIPLPEPPQPEQADFLLVDKSARTLTVFSRGRVIRTYTGLQFGDQPFGHKRFEGDERTPEGLYFIDARNPRSDYYLSLRISYPNAADRAQAAALGRSPGGNIFIHGQPNWMMGARREGDWTDGCIALSNAEMAELWYLVPDGTPIEIRAWSPPCPYAYCPLPPSS